MISEILLASLLDSCNWLVLSLLILGSLALWKNSAARFLIHFLLPLVITIALFQVLPETAVGMKNTLYHWTLFVFFFLSLYGIQIQRWLSHTTRASLHLFFFYLALGFFSLHLGFWYYFLFHGAQKEPPGSFRLKGVHYALQQTEGWKFHRLNDLIRSHWLYPTPIHLEPKPYPKNAHRLLVEGIEKSEAFRRSLLEIDAEGNLPAERIAEALLEFIHQSEPFLQGRPSLERFHLSVNEIVQKIEGSFDKDVTPHLFKAFTGRWYGKWEEMEVEHHWRPVQIYDPPFLFGESEYLLDALQYTWVGNGFGWNLIILPEDADTNVILGTVYPIQDQNTDLIKYHKPHVGIEAGFGGLIWVTEGEIIFEEVIDNRDNDDVIYVITVFRYRRDEYNSSNHNAFQAILTRDSNNRPPFYTFHVPIQVP